MTSTTTPLYGPFEPDDDLALTGPLPQDPAALETFNVWLYDGHADIAFNLHNYAQHGEFRSVVTAFLPDGSVLRGQGEPGRFTDPWRPGNDTVTVTVVEPFARWNWDVVNLPAWRKAEADLDRPDAGVAESSLPMTSTISLHADAEVAAPPWDWGWLLTEAKQATNGKVGLWIANRLTDGRAEGVSFRYDQAVRASGTLMVDGQQYAFDGVGVRGHVRGVRVMGGFGTHNWMEAVFPSGLALGVNVMFRPDGGYFSNEGYVYSDGVFHPSRVRWATALDPASADRAEFVIELVNDALGLTRITGTDRRALWRSFGTALSHSHELTYGRDLNQPRLMCQAVAEYRHEDEVGYGLDERSGWGLAGPQQL